MIMMERVSSLFLLLAAAGAIILLGGLTGETHGEESLLTYLINLSLSLAQCVAANYTGCCTGSSCHVCMTLSRYVYNFLFIGCWFKPLLL